MGLWTPGVRSVLLRTLAFFTVLEAMLVPAVLFWPNFRDNIATLKAMAPLPMLRDMVDTLGTGGVAAYLLGQQYFKGCNSLGVAAAVLFAVGAVAGEAERGTLEIWLARPLSRKRLLSERWLAGALAVALPVFASSATIPFLLGYVDESMSQRGLFFCSLHQTLFLLCVYSGTFLLSTVGRRPIALAFLVLFFMTFQFALYLVKTATHWSLFRQADLTTFMSVYAEAAPPAGKTLGLAAFVLACYVASLACFERRVP
jgi:ABC-type transport system involved in multi-copper enzyme maturation permease subunit